MLKAPQQTGIKLKTPDEVEKMRAAGRVVAVVLDTCTQACVPDITTLELDKLAFATFTELGADSLFKGYPDYVQGKGFPGNICISINEEIVHGIPGDRVIANGDVVTIDCGVKLKGWCGDAANTLIVGDTDKQTCKMVETTKEILNLAIDMIKPGIMWSTIAKEMQAVALNNGYGIIREYVGHGIGRILHEMPKVPNYVSKSLIGNDFQLQTGMVIAIEPMLTLGSGKTLSLSDGWTVITQDKYPAAHQEHTVAVKENGADILTLLN